MKHYVGTYVFFNKADKGVIVIDYIEELATLAIVSRLRRLLYRMVADGQKIYHDLGFAFKVKWFPVLHLLADRGPMSLTEIASTLGVAHPSMIEVTEDMVAEGLLVSERCDSDKRKRELSLTGKGRRLCAELEPVWQAFREAGDEINRDRGNDFLASIGKMELAMDQCSLYERIMSRLHERK